MCMFCGFSVYVTQCVGFICLRLQFADLPRSWYSPLGIPGAVFSILIFTVGMTMVSEYTKIFHIDLHIHVSFHQFIHTQCEYIVILDHRI
jgi:hypothetical protein